MAHRRFEMFQYRQALVRMRQDASDCQIASVRHMGRRTAARLRQFLKHNWLDPALAMPEDEQIARAMAQSKRTGTTVSSLAAQRQRIQDWAEQGVTGWQSWPPCSVNRATAGATRRAGRILPDIRTDAAPKTTCRLDFEPGDAAVQVDFGAEPMLSLTNRRWAISATTPGNTYLMRFISLRNFRRSSFEISDCTGCLQRTSSKPNY